MVQWECTGNGQFGNQRKSCSKEKLLALLVFNLISVRIFSSSCPNFATKRTSSRASWQKICWQTYSEMYWQVSCQLDMGGMLAGCSDLDANAWQKSDHRPSSGLEPSSQRPIGVFRPPLFPLRTTMMALPGLLPPRCMASGMGSSA